MKFKIIKTLIIINFLFSAVVLAGCPKDDSPANNSENETATVFLETRADVPNEVATGSEAVFNTKVDYGTNSAINSFVVSATQSGTASINYITYPTASNVNITPITGDVGPGEYCYANGVGATLSQGQSCTVSFLAESNVDNTTFNGTLAAGVTTDEGESTLTKRFNTTFVSSSSISNTISLENDTAPILSPDTIASFVIENQNSSALNNLKLHLGSLPSAVFDGIQTDTITGGTYNATDKTIDVDSDIAAGETHTISFQLKGNIQTALFDNYSGLTDNTNQNLIYLSASNAQDFSPDLSVLLIPATLTSATFHSPGTQNMLLTNHSNDTLTIDSFTENSLPTNVSISDNECTSGQVISAGGSCQIPMVATQNAHGATTGAVTVRFHDSNSNSFTTDDQVEAKSVIVEGITLALQNENFMVTHDKTVDVEIKNEGNFDWQLPDSADYDRVFTATDTDDNPVSGLSITDPKESSPACKNGKVAPDSTCFIGIHADTSVDSDAQYLLKTSRAHSVNLLEDLTDNFAIISSVTTGISNDEGTVYPAIKSIKLINTTAAERIVTASIDHSGFDVYDNTGQTWCNTTVCSNSCFTSTSPFSGGNFSLPSIASGTPGTCYIYLHTNESTVGNTQSAILTVGNIGSSGGETKDFNLSGDTILYAGGNFTKSGDGTITNLGYIAEFDGTAWQPVGNNDGFNNIVNTLYVGGNGYLYVGGDFTQTGDGAITNLGRIAFYNGSSWAAVGGSEGFNNDVRAMGIDSNNTLYIGGSFVRTGDNSISSLGRVAQYENGHWSTIGATQGFNTHVRAMAIRSNNVIYVAGNFAQSGDRSITHLGRIAQYNGSTWSALGSTQGFNNTVFALTKDNSDNLYAGGSFTTSGDGAITNLGSVAEFDGSNWSAIGDNKGFNSTVRTLALDSSGNLYVGGQFVRTGDRTLTSLGRIAKFDGSRWSAVGTTQGFNHTLRAIAIDGNNNIYVGGDFIRTADKSIKNLGRIAYYNGSTWQAVGAAQGFNAQVYTLALATTISVSD